MYGYDAVVSYGFRKNHSFRLGATRKGNGVRMTVPLSPPKNSFLTISGQNNADNFPLKTPTSAYI